jgi:hypothetical protein
MTLRFTHADAEAQFRQVLVDNGLAAPDAVEYHPDELVFLWMQQKVAIVVDLDGGCSAA